MITTEQSDELKRQTENVGRSLEVEPDQNSYEKLLEMRGSE